MLTLMEISQQWGKRVCHYCQDTRAQSVPPGVTEYAPFTRPPPPSKMAHVNLRMTALAEDTRFDVHTVLR